MTTEEMTQTINGIEIRRNLEQNGVEIHFPAKPGYPIILKLKAALWRWNQKKGVWYQRMSPDNMKFAQELAESVK